MSNSEKINTYCSGSRLMALNDISRAKFIAICNKLGSKFNNHYNSNNYKFLPEAISEGGIIFCNFNDRLAYKTMRICKISTTFGDCNLYGWITDNIEHEWKNDQTILIQAGQRLDTCLKSFKSAPKWTQTELDIFEKTFEEYGIEIIKKINIE